MGVGRPESYYNDLILHMDRILLAATDGYDIPLESIRALPPWRAVLLVRVATKAGAKIERGYTLDALVAAAVAAGGAGTLKDFGAIPHQDR